MDRCGQGQSALSPEAKPERNRNGDTPFAPKPSVEFSSVLYSLAPTSLIHWLNQRRVAPNTSGVLVFSILLVSPLSNACSETAAAGRGSFGRTPSWSQSNREGSGRDLLGRGGRSF